MECYQLTIYFLPIGFIENLFWKSVFDYLSVYLNNFTVFSYKKVLFFVGKIGVIKIKLPNKY